MKRNYRNRNHKNKIPTKYMLLILSGFCVLAILFSLTFNISGGPLNSVAGYIFVPMQKGINNVGNQLLAKANDFKTLKEVLAENKELQQQVDDLTTELNTRKLEEYELDNYRELFDLNEKYPTYEKIAASVIAKDTGNWFSTFTIDKGKNDGIDVGMNVIAGSGLVGIVTDVGPNYSKIRSIINDASNTSGMVSTTEDNLNVSGNLKLMNTDKVIEFNELRDEDDEVAIGDPVVTSYVSDQYLQGILIGYISSVEQNENNLTKSGTITPIVDFEHLQNVLVITTRKSIGADNKANNSSTEADTEASTEASTESSSETESNN